LLADDGLGKRSSAYEYRVTGRGGQGLANVDLTRGDEAPEVQVVASFPVADSDELVLVTDGGQLIRCPVSGIRIAGRTTRGVKVFRVGEDERVVSVAHLADVDADEEEPGEDGPGEDRPGEDRPVGEGPEEDPPGENGPDADSGEDGPGEDTPGEAPE
jgi:DNA gyrase subunit A